MAATADQIAELRRKIAEPTTTTYADTLLAAYIERYPLIDERGEPPYTFTALGAWTTPPTPLANAVWIPTYDLNHAAADLWEEKAASLATNYGFSSLAGNYQLQQQYDHAMRQALHYRARRAMRSMTLRPEPVIIPQVESNAT